MTQRFIAGVDIGGTKTRIMVACGGKPVADETLVTGFWRIREVETDGKALAGMVNALCSDEASTPAPRRLAVGAHGCDTDEQCLHFQAPARHLPAARCRWSTMPS